mmetsp:Transcript_61039/g.122388  ORF Transcript_61039/g.122388 Transcript_61039/m.122388 type:complete len:208 (+) Transcript_61039:330-953(+)
MILRIVDALVSSPGALVVSTSPTARGGVALAAALAKAAAVGASTTACTSSCVPATTTAAAAEGATKGKASGSAGNLGGKAVPAARALRRSPLVIRPPLPLPARLRTSRPWDAARWLAEGMSKYSSATLRPSTAATLAPLAVPAGFAAAGASSAAATAPPPPPSAVKSAKAATSAEASSASSTMTTTGVPTAISWPASTRILATTPGS